MPAIRISDIKLVIFDLDGTLVNAYRAITRSVNYTLHKLNYPAQDSLAIRRAVGWGDENLLRPFVGPRDLRRALRLYRRHHRKALLKYTSLFPGVKLLLRYLKTKGYSLAVASNRPTRFSREIIRHLGLGRYFDYILCKDALRYGKPHPQILNKIMQKFSVKPGETVYVGDMHIDAEAGRRAKISTIIVTTGSSTRRQIQRERPFCIIRRVRGVSKIL